MNYRIRDIKGQLIATLRADTNLSDVKIESHAGQISPQYFLNAEYKEGLIARLPIIFVRYSGRTLVIDQCDSSYKTNTYELHWQFFVCSKNLRTREEAENEAEDYLECIYDDIHGRRPYSTETGLADSSSRLSGTQITNPNFKASVFITQGGEDEQLVVDMPGIVVYRADYKTNVIA